MAIDVATFRASYPEMLNVPDAFTLARLVEAEGSIDVEALGSRNESAVFAYAAHLIATSPGGLMARLASDRASSTYLMLYKRIVAGALGGPALGV
jgi:hypothetical protein